MASTVASKFPPLDSYSTAVVLVPPPHLQHAFNLFRSANDKSHPRWTAHITLLFPFVHPSSLPDAVSRLRAAVSAASHPPFPLTLDHVGKFTNRSYNTVFLAPSDAARVQALWHTLADAAGYKGRAFAPHLTLGQAHAPWELGFLQEKGEALLRNYTPAAWDVGSVVVLRKDEADGGKMKVVEEIPLDTAAFAPSAIVPETPLTYDMASGHLCSMAEHLSDLPDGRIGLTTFNVLTDDTHSPAHRFALLKRDLLSRPADILCLQEVPDALLPLLLDDADILARFAYCTHAPNSVLPNRQNIVVLSSVNLPFAWSIVSLGESKRKSSAVLTFGGSRRLVLAVVHLTAGHEPAPVMKRAAELAELVSYLRAHHAEDSWIIAGDTNLDTDSLPEACADVLTDTWAMLHPNDAGLTYEPSRNALAAETVKAVRDPYRYDRVLVRKAGGVHAAEIAVLRSAPGEAPASDHWALHAILDVSGTLASSAATVVPAHVESASQATAFETPAKTISDDNVRCEEDSDLEAAVRAARGYPSPEQDTARDHAFDVLRMALAGSAPSNASGSQPFLPALPAGVKVVLELVGSRALGVDTASSDLDVLAVGNLGQGTFFELARSRIRTWRRACEANGGSEVVLKRFVRDAAVPMMRLAVGGVEIDLQYAPAAKVVERWSEVPTLTSEDPMFSLPVSTLRTLNAHRDNLRLRSMLPATHWPAFRLVLRALKVFAETRGISGSRFGFLGGVHLTVLLARVMLAKSADTIPSATDTLRTFVVRYAAFDWTAEPVSVGGAVAGSTYRRTPREALAILSVERPVINVASAATTANVAALRAELARANEMLGGGASWADVCASPAQAATAFLREHKTFVRLDMSFWGSDPVRGRALLGYVESRLIKLLLDLGHALSGVHPRLWPHPFGDSESSSHADRTINLSYLVGITSDTAFGILQNSKTLHNFEQSVHSCAYYDPSEAYFGVLAADATEVGGLELLPVPLPWADGGVDAADGDDDDVEDALPAGTSPGESTYTERTLDDFLAAGRAPERPAERMQAPGGRLRTSADVYNRLMWDASADAADYVVGYVDRFEGIMEMPLLSFKREVEDEAFVPFHRVEYFRRKSDSVRVWDRRSRVDLVFGSGNPST